MSLPDPVATPAANLLDRVNLSATERLRAEAALLRGEYLADLMLTAIKVLREFGRQLAYRPKTPRQLKSAG